MAIERHQEGWRHLPRFLGFVLALNICMGVAWGQDDPPVATPDDTFVMALLGDPWTFDPAVVFRVTESRIVHNLYEGLYMPAPGDGEVVPAVALSHEVSEDGLTYTFHLRPEAHWSNGDPVTAHDFVTAWRRVLSPATGSPYAYLMYYLRNGQAFANGEVTAEEVGASAIDDHTLQVELEVPVPFFVQLTAFCNFFPVHTPTVEALGPEAFLIDHLVSNGPYRLVAFEPGSHVYLGQSTEYWDRDSLEIQVIHAAIFSDPEMGLAAYHDGLVDWISELPWDTLPALRARPDFQTHPMFGTYYFRVNVAAPAVSDPRVRQALALSIDREALCRDVLDGLCEVAMSFVPPLPTYEPTNLLSFDPALARELLAEAGYPNGSGFPELTLLINQMDIHERVGRAVQEMWRSHLNISSELSQLEWGAYLESLDSGDFQVARFGWVGDYLDPDSFLFLMASDNVEMNSGWSNVAYDALLGEASQTVDVAHRTELFQQAESILLEDVAVIPLFYYTQYHLVRPNVTGFEMNLRDVHLVRYISK